MTDRTYSLIAAQPGFAMAIFDEAINGFEFDPIVAWSVETATTRPSEEPLYSVTPITASGSPESLANVSLIRRPDGSFDAPYDASFANEPTALAWAREQVAARAENELSAAHEQRRIGNKNQALADWARGNA